MKKNFHKKILKNRFLSKNENINFSKDVIQVVRKKKYTKIRGNSNKKKGKTLSYHLMCNLINIIVI